jgi:hypothetical protein
MIITNLSVTLMSDLKGGKIFRYGTRISLRSILPPALKQYVKGMTRPVEWTPEPLFGERAGQNLEPITQLLVIEDRSGYFHHRH